MLLGARIPMQQSNCAERGFFCGLWLRLNAGGPGTLGRPWIRQAVGPIVRRMKRKPAPQRASLH